MNWEKVMLLFEVHDTVIFRLEGVGEQQFSTDEIFQVIREIMELLDDQNESLRLDVRDSILEEERLNEFIDHLANYNDHLEREILELRGED